MAGADRRIDQRSTLPLNPGGGCGPARRADSVDPFSSIQPGEVVVVVRIRDTNNHAPTVVPEVVVTGLPRPEVPWGPERTPIAVINVCSAGSI